jgi:hypothetical protein
MENNKQMELEILIAIRNNQTIPADEFHTIFDDRWPDYRTSMVSLYNKGLLINSCHAIIPGLNIWELTGAGKLRISELLFERSNDLAKMLSEKIKIKKLLIFPVWSSLLGISNFVSHFPSRFKRQVH